MEPRRVRSTDFEVPDASAHPTETAVGFILEIGGQVTGLAQRQVHAFGEVLTRLTVSGDDLVGHDRVQEGPQLVPECLVLIGQLNA